MFSSSMRNESKTENEQYGIWLPRSRPPPSPSPFSLVQPWPGVVWPHIGDRWARVARRTRAPGFSVLFLGRLSVTQIGHLRQGRRRSYTYGEKSQFPRPAPLCFVGLFALWPLAFGLWGSSSCPRSFVRVVSWCRRVQSEPIDPRSLILCLSCIRVRRVTPRVITYAHPRTHAPRIPHPA